MSVVPSRATTSLARLGAARRHRSRQRREQRGKPAQKERGRRDRRSSHGLAPRCGRSARAAHFAGGAAALSSGVAAYGVRRGGRRHRCGADRISCPASYPDSPGPDFPDSNAVSTRSPTRCWPMYRTRPYGRKDRAPAIPRLVESGIVVCAGQKPCLCVVDQVACIPCRFGFGVIGLRRLLIGRLQLGKAAALGFERAARRLQLLAQLLRRTLRGLVRWRNWVNSSSSAESFSASGRAFRADPALVSPGDPRSDPAIGEAESWRCATPPAASHRRRHPPAPSALSPEEDRQG